MKTICLGLLAGLFLSIHVQAQNFQPINSGEVINNGVSLHDKGKYKEAIALYRQVPRNDTNYAQAQYELALTLTADSNFNEALTICEKGIQLDNITYESSFRILYGSILDDLGEQNRAIQVYDSALVKYPQMQNLLLNKAVTLMRMKKYDEAETMLKDLITRNPFYSSAQYRLGLCELNKGQIVPAMMCFFTYLLNNPSGNYSSHVIKLIDNISKSTDMIMDYINQRKEQPSGNFAMVEQIMLSKIALDKNYKVLTDLDDPIFRQLQVMMEKLQFDESNPDFFMQFYVPYLKDIYNKNLFEPSIYEAFSGVQIDKIQRYLKKNSKEKDQAMAVIGANWDGLRSTREISFAKRASAPALYHFDDGVFYAKGKLNGDNPTGSWTFYHDNGNIKSTGSFNDNGKKEGKWTYYFSDGKLSGYDNWKNGVQDGEDLTYNRYGVLSAKAMYSNGKLTGEKTSFYALGHPFSIQQYKDDKGQGSYTEFYSSGLKKIVANMEDDQLSGIYRSFYENGQPQIVTNYEKGKLNGNYKSYYDNGQLEFECTYKNGQPEGQGLTYHPNGKIKTKVQYVNGVQEGEEQDYNDEGVLVSKSSYKNGKSIGQANYYSDEGKLYATYVFDNDKIKSATFFDKSGKELSTSNRQGKSILLTMFTADGFKTAAFTLNDQGEKQNNNTLYYNSGKVRETSNYKDGKIEGLLTGYFENGKKSYEAIYSNDKKNGILKNYYADGSIKSETWYKDDELNGNSIVYNMKGHITSISTYLNNDLYGTRQNFFENGKLDDEEVYKNGWLQSVYQYDSTGKMIHVSKLENGSGKYDEIYPNGQKLFEGTYVQGSLHGAFTKYFFDGSVENTRTYNHGLLDGDYKEYFYGGKLSVEGKYTMGKKTGTWKFYSSEGKLTREEPYVNGEENGTEVSYFPNGKINQEISYKNDEKNGIMKRYSDDGQLSGIFYYKEGEITGYSYNDKEGKPVPVIPVPGGNGKVKTYFSNSNVSSEMEFNDGKLTGPYKLYFPNGKVYYNETNQDNGLTVGMTEQYYGNGNLQSSYNYYYNNGDGAYKEYYENGKLKVEGTLYNGQQNGVQTFYDPTGKVTGKRTYYYGLMLNATK